MPPKNDTPKNQNEEKYIPVVACEESIIQKVDHQGKLKHSIDINLFLNDLNPIELNQNLYVLLVTETFLADNLELYQNWFTRNNLLDFRIIILSEKKNTREKFSSIPENFISNIVPTNIDSLFLEELIHQTFIIIKLNREKFELKKHLNLSTREIYRLAKIGKLLGKEHDFERLIRLILIEFVKLVYADSGSIYIVEHNEKAQTTTYLRFKSTYLDLDINEFLLPINSSSIAGYVALTGKPLLIDDVYRLPENLEYRFNYSLDKEYNYRTKSMMIVPIKNHEDRIIGVIQLINRKKESKIIITPENTQDTVISFSTKDYAFIDTMAGQAGVALENNILLKDIQNLFEGFVTAAITAVEQRDVTTSGHSFRVANFTVELAKAVDSSHRKPFRNMTFSNEQIKEIRYAGLLHDFGKVAVKEEVLLKAKKLYPQQLEVFRWRYYFFREKTMQEYLQKKLNIVENSKSIKNSQMKLSHLERELNQKLRELDNMFHCVLKANEPSIMEEGNFEVLKKMMECKVEIHTGEIKQFLYEDELISLATRKGSLNQTERTEIESHVTHTYSFLKKIPWTHDLKSIPEIAHGHHEKLDGSGYPLGLKANQISPQTRMMTIADIYDALTAPDRPYKASIPNDKALDIIKYEVDNNHIDPDLFDLFVEKKIYESVSTTS